MKQPTFSSFKSALDGKAAVIVISESRRIKKQLETAVAKNRIRKDPEVRRILKFCNYITECTDLPSDLSKEDREFYKRTVEKLIQRKMAPPNLAADFEGSAA